MKQSCTYCGGHTVDDERGNCGACGAPRKEPQHLDPQYEWIDVTALGDKDRVYIRGTNIPRILTNAFTGLEDFRKYTSTGRLVCEEI